MRLISTAIEQNIALGPLVEARAKDESEPHKTRLLRLARLLDSGMPLANAVEEVHGALTDQDALTVRFGTQTGILDAAIIDRVHRSELALGYRSSNIRQLVPYLIFVTVLALIVTTFWQIRIVPALIDIFQEFNLKPPGPLKVSVLLVNSLASLWYLIPLTFLILWLLLFSPTPGRKIRRQLSSRLMQPIRQLRIADVLHKLGVAKQAGRPMAGVVSTLARYHFDPVLRHQLLFVRNELEHGAGIWASMGAVDLLTPPEIRALDASESLNNCPWVLHELASLKERRVRSRLAALGELALPLVILVFGAFVLLQSLAMFQSMVSIIYSLL